ncbi:styrene monooxygenase/indole monooxygenase family protein [Streptomyces sp. UNOB3_S3]|uniref:styrene monooxygenase/indole monooxygenase family protein n=1 Tax=Streptomyces sp. UNOB3_S3 TaxID=2871682 RepID=UPI001E408AE6|nr:styrene monooxygenase/indole monooxygenase family protein [Streptomyces sp. UNOB3_S3]MCC3779396.1 FAD-binding oxidoreductase [Streptomyces sp. UNOB3_S3]
MRRILIVGAGQSGLQLALGLQAKGYDVTVMSNRTPEEIRSGRVMSTQMMFRTALRYERELGLNFWEGLAPRALGLGFSVAGTVPGVPGVQRPVDWIGRLDGYAQSVDQRVKMAGWLDAFAERGGRLVVHAAAVSDLDFLAPRHDLVLVAAGKGELVSLFRRDPARSPYTTPQRALALAYVHGLGPRAEHPEYDAARCTIVPGVGELWVIPTLTTSGRADILFWEGLPGGPVDVFQDVEGPGEHLTRTLELLEWFVPWEYGRATAVELTDPGATLAGRYVPAVRDPVGRLPSGGLVLGVGDAVVVNDPLTGQGANSAAKCAASYLASIVERGDEPFDAEWMRTAFERYWASARHVTRWTNTMLGPRSPHIRALIDAAAGLQPVADRVANGFDDPSDFDDYFYDASAAEAYVAETRALTAGYTSPGGSGGT